MVGYYNMSSIYENICPFCGKKFTSLYKTQLEQNYETHLKYCKERNNNNNNNNNNTSLGEEEHE